ncbi:hypothetical protein AFE_1092 [Acidithiobacillus ferrooxidans ATCC 23270]|uniref:Uncharacterized protein n=1 Tax=Acidithiobacillus ferrooxidans (strain ATCC 23270 / DSM 14882 / CIP 104768 / NCIMB 8455) TaxID=243159 RepID=B7J841_ACIF2|nr:hypothetical protein AFE_1092 [Acidithiobacillus ferrooxidans ATCC 23270]
MPVLAAIAWVARDPASKVVASVVRQTIFNGFSSDLRSATALGIAIGLACWWRGIWCYWWTSHFLPGVALPSCAIDCSTIPYYFICGARWIRSVIRSG